MSLREILSLMGVNQEELLHGFCDNEALLERVMRKFPQEETYSRLAAAVEAGDAELMLNTSHTLKGITANMGFNQLYQLSADMVTSLRAGEEAKAAEIFPELAKEYRRLTALIARLDEEETEK